MSTRDSRMETLNNEGVDTSRYFDVNNTDEVVVNDDISTQIITDGYVKNTKLHRRWVMAQMFRMMNWKPYRSSNLSGYDGYLKYWYGYNYQFTMMLEEVRVLSKLEDRDYDSFDERSRFFSIPVVGSICETYVSNLCSHIGRMRKRKCKGRPYIRLKKTYIFTDNLDKKVFNGLNVRLNRIKKARNYKDLYKVLSEFVNTMPKLPYNFEKIWLWTDTFKNNGAYYTLKNLVMYHNCTIYTDERNYTGVEGVNYLRTTLDNHSINYMNMLEKCISDNNFNFKERMEEIYS